MKYCFETYLDVFNCANGSDCVLSSFLCPKISLIEFKSCTACCPPTGCDTALVNAECNNIFCCCAACWACWAAATTCTVRCWLFTCCCCCVVVVCCCCCCCVVWWKLFVCWWGNCWLLCWFDENKPGIDCAEPLFKLRPFCVVLDDDWFYKKNKIRKKIRQ